MNLQQKFQDLEQWFLLKKALVQQFFKKKKDRSSVLLCSKGEVYFAQWGTNIGAELDKARPVVIFQSNNRYNRYADTVFALPITSNTKKKKYKVLFNAADIYNGSLQPGGILIQHGRSLCKTRLQSKLGSLSESVLLEVQKSFHNFLGMKDYTPVDEDGGLSVGQAQQMSTL